MEQNTEAYYYIAPASNLNDEYAAGYDGNRFDSLEEARATIPALRASGPEFDIEWSIVRISPQGDFDEFGV
jgi:hypothetical protein